MINNGIPAYIYIAMGDTPCCIKGEPGSIVGRGLVPAAYLPNHPKEHPTRVLFFIYNRYACPAFAGSKWVEGVLAAKKRLPQGKKADFWLKIGQNAGYEMLWPGNKK